MKVREADRALEQGGRFSRGSAMTRGSDDHEVINVSLLECVKDQLTGWHWRGMEKASRAATENDTRLLVHGVCLCPILLVPSTFPAHTSDLTIMVNLESSSCKMCSIWEGRGAGGTF